MSNKTRPSAASFLSSSTKAHQTQQELAEAQARIAALELDGSVLDLLKSDLEKVDKG